MDMQNFKDEALSTEAPANEDVLRRIVRTYPMFAEHLTETIHTGEFLDKVKKYVFYGKEDASVEDGLTPAWPTGEKKERIHQMGRILHGLIGVHTEGGELSEEIVDYIEGHKELDVNHIKEECFDILWYINLILACCGTSIPAVCEQGILKLRERYPNRFTSYDALHRDTVKEMNSFVNPHSSMSRNPA